MSSLRLALKQSLQETGHLAPKEKKKRKNQKQNQQQQQQQQSRPLKPPRRKRLPGDPPRKRGRPPKHPRPEPEQQDEEEEEDNNNDNGNNNEKQHNHKDNNNKDNDSEEEEESTENEFSYDSESNDEDDEEESDEESHNSSEEEVDEENEDDVADAATATRPSVPSHDDDDEEEEEHETEEEEDQDVRDRRKQLKLQKKLLARKQLHNDATTTTATGIGDEEEEDHQRQRKQQRQKKLKQRKELKQHSAAHTIQSQWKRKKEHGQTTTTSGTPHHSAEQSQQSSKAPSAAGAPRTTSPVPTTKQPALHNKRVKSPPPNENTTAAATSHDNNHNHDTKKKKRNKHRDDKESSNNNNKDSSSPSKSRTVPPPTLEILDWASTLSQRKSRKHMTSGLRVKVRFATKVKRDGKVIKKKKWYGGRVSAVSKEGSKIRIKYDDGTSEISKFPDKDVVVDEQGNGQHLVSGEKFVPPPSPVVAPTVEEKEEEEAVSDDNEDEEDQEAEMVMEEPPQPASSIVEATTSTTSETKQLPSSSSKEEEKDEKPKSISPISKPPTVSKATTATTTMSSESHTIAPEKEPIPVIVLEKSSPTAAAAAVVAVVDTPVADQDQKATKDVKPPVEQLPPVPNIVLEEQQKAPTIAPVASHAPMLFGSPTEEGELSPGLTYSKDSKIPSKPVDLGTLESVPGFEKETETSSPESDGVGVVVPAAPAATSTVTAVESESSVPKEDSKEKVKEAPPRPSFKIRISQVKADRHDSKKTQAILDAAAHNESSEEEIFEATPANQRGRRPGEHGEDKIKRKRSSNDLSDTAPPSKRRIHLKKHQVDTNNTPDQSHDATETAAGESQEEPSGVAAAGEEPITSEQGEGLSEHKEKPKISVTIRRPQSTTEMEDETIPLAPPASAPGKKRKLGERSSSPKIRIRSPGAQSPTPVVARTESPAPMSGERVETKALSKPAVTVSAGIDVGTAEAQPSSGTKIHLVLTGSKNSAFERKQPKAAKEGKNTGDGELSEPALEEGEEDAAPFVGKSKLRRSKNSTESLPAVRSGRRAAQQAKDRIKSKDGEPSDMEPGTKKKKKRKMDGNDSENSEDDRQWVQCDNCGKWRILPSTVKLSSLPKHWYCDMNIYDPKRMSCTAAEQTPKQVAKEYKRAKKRARQRLEQEQSAMEAIPEEGEAKDVRAEKTPPHVAPSSPRAADDVSPREQTVTAKESSKKNKRVSPAAAAEENDPAVPSDSGSDNKGDKKASVGKNVKSQDAVDAVEPAPAVLEAAVEPKAKPGRRRGRPARDPNKDSDSRTSSTDKPGDGENVEWVQCEKCDKWRKLPHHITADELPDVWYCTMNTWNPNSASCETDEDIADALHQDVSSGNAIPGNPGKFSYRSLIFGTGRKHNRPMSERSRAGESLFQRPFDEIDNPYPTVMYSKSSAFLARTSNFNKASTVDEKTTSVFDVMSNSELWVELRGAAQPLNVISGGNYGQQKECYRYDNLPGDMKNSWRELVLYALGLGTLTGDEVLLEAQDRQWEDMPTEWLEMRSNCTEDIVVNTLLQLVRDGQVEMTCSREPHLPIEQWVPKYRKVRRRREADEAVTASRCMKISKPWKQREESNSDWISGRTAFA